MTTAAVRPVTPVKCTPWCGDGTGHPSAEEADEQGCYSVERSVKLAQTPVPGQGARSGSQIAVQLYRDAYPDGAGGAFLEPPHIEIFAYDVDQIRLSPSEARELSAVLSEMADAAQSR